MYKSKKFWYAVCNAKLLSYMAESSPLSGQILDLINITLYMSVYSDTMGGKLFPMVIECPCHPSLACMCSVERLISEIMCRAGRKTLLTHSLCMCSGWGGYADMSAAVILGRANSKSHVAADHPIVSCLPLLVGPRKYLLLLCGSVILNQIGIRFGRSTCMQVYTVCTD